MIERWQLIRLLQLMTLQYRLKYGLSYIYLMQVDGQWTVLKQNTGHPRILTPDQVEEMYTELQFDAVVGYKSGEYVVLVHSVHFNKETVTKIVNGLSQLEPNCGREVLKNGLRD